MGQLGEGGGQIGSVYKQPKTEEDDSCHSWRVPSKWKGVQRGAKGTARGIRKGSKGKCAMYICNHNVLMKEQLNVWMMLLSCTCNNNKNERVVYIIITRMNVVDNLNSV